MYAFEIAYLSQLNGLAMEVDHPVRVQFTFIYHCYGELLCVKGTCTLLCVGYFKCMGGYKIFSALMQSTYCRVHLAESIWLK